MLRSTLALLFAIVATPALSQSADAAYPTRTIRIVVSSPAGGSTDVVGRILGDELSKRLGQAVVVENRVGANGNIGGGSVATAAPDGYTLLVSQPGPLSYNAALHKKKSYDPATLARIVLASISPNVLAVRAGLPIHSVAELIAYAKANPGKLTYGSQGIGSTAHLTAKMFEQKTGTVLTHVPYGGSAPALTALISGNIDLFFADIPGLLPFHTDGTARIIGAATAERLPAIPNIPTVGEAGIADFLSATWVGVAAPPKTPDAITNKLNGVLNEILATPDIREKIANIGTIPKGGSRAAFSAFIDAEVARWGGVIRAANISLD